MGRKASELSKTTDAKTSVLEFRMSATAHAAPAGTALPEQPSDATVKLPALRPTILTALTVVD